MRKARSIRRSLAWVTVAFTIPSLLLMWYAEKWLDFGINLAAELLGLALGLWVAIHYVERVVEKRAQEEALKSWNLVRDYFLGEIKAATSKFLSSISDNGWGMPEGGVEEAGPTGMYEYLREQLKKTYRILKFQQPSSTDRQALKEKWEGTWSGDVVEEAVRLRARLQELLSAHLPGAFQNEFICDAWAAYGGLSTLIEPERKYDELFVKFDLGPGTEYGWLNRGQVLLDVICRLEPLWQHAVVPEDVEARALARKRRQDERPVWLACIVE